MTTKVGWRWPWASEPTTSRRTDETLAEIDAVADELDELAASLTVRAAQLRARKGGTDDPGR